MGKKGKVVAGIGAGILALFLPFPINVLSVIVAMYLFWKATFGKAD